MAPKPEEASKEELLTNIAVSLTRLRNRFDELRLENLFDELLSKLDRIDAHASLTANAITALSDEFLPVARRASQLMNGGPTERLRAAMKKS